MKALTAHIPAAILAAMTFCAPLAAQSNVPAAPNTATASVNPATTATGSTSSAPAPSAAAPAPEAIGQPLNSAEGDYILNPGDVIEMTIFREPELTSRSAIAGDGTVQLPLIKEVKLAGLTVRSARERLTALYNDNFLVNPQVYLNVIGYAKRHFTILGQINRPGSYDLQGGQTLTLLEAIGMAGGFTRIADQGRISIRREENGEPHAIRANAKRIADGKDPALTILPGDVITIGESWY